MGNDATCKVIGIENITNKIFVAVVGTMYDVKHIHDLRKNLVISHIYDKSQKIHSFFYIFYAYTRPTFTVNA